LLFAAVFGLLALAGLWERSASALWWLGAALVTLGVALFAHPLLAPLNRGWRRFSLFLFKFVNPLVMAVMYFVVITPVALLMRRSGKDPLRLRADGEAKTYWIMREDAERRPTAMTRQF
jgi:hypothetical protein